MFSALKHSLSGELGTKTAPSGSTESVDGSKENVAPTDKSGNLTAGPVPAIVPSTPKASSAPITTTTYTVEGSDTLMSIAARFDTTPSELTKLNRLSSRYLYPGQSLLVPLKNSPGGPTDLSTQNSTASTQRTDANAESGRQNSRAEDLDSTLDQECLERFLKLRVRHVTDGQGIVGGVLLITPNAIMFDPDVSDPLVLERGGAECYGFIAPMECLANAAIYNDIAHMRVKDTKLPKPDLPKPEIYYSPGMKPPSAPSDSSLVNADPLKVDATDAEDVDSPLVLTKDSTFPELNVVGGDSGTKGGASSTGSQDDDSSCSCGGDTRDASAFPKAFEHELLTPETYPHSPLPSTDETSPSSNEQQQQATQQSTHETLHESFSSGGGLQHSSHPLMTIEEDVPPQSHTTDNSITIGNTASRNVSCDSAVSVSSEVDLPIGGSDLSVDTMDAAGGAITSCVEPPLSCSSAPPPRLSAQHGEDLMSQASRKQKVLKRLSNPLSWMDSFNSDSGGNVPSGGSFSSGGSSTPPVLGGVLPSSAGQASDPNSGGMLSSMFNMTSNVTSNVSNMLTRRPSLDLAARRAAPTPSLSQETPPTSAPPSLSMTTATCQQQQTLTTGGGEQKRALYKDGANVGFRSLVPMDDVSNLFTNVDKIVRPKQQESLETALYLCLRMGLPKTLPRSPFMSYGTTIIKAEYWFSIPRNRASDLCRLVNIWSSGSYGEIDESKMASRGLTLILEDTDLSSLEDSSKGGNGSKGSFIGGSNGGSGGSMDEMKEITKEMTRESWEKIKAPYTKFYSIVKSQMTLPGENDSVEVGSMSEELKRALYSSTSLTSLDVESLLPEMQDESAFIDHQTYKNLYRNLPARLQGYSWCLAFSTTLHGFSLSSLYRKMAELSDSPVVLAVQDTQQTVFGAVLSNTLRVSDGFYGTGESFMFTCHPKFKTFNWTGENNYFIKGNNESLVLGGGDNFGLWLDGDLYRGRTQPCKTFNNPVLGPSEDFVIKSLECWAFL